MSQAESRSARAAFSAAISARLVPKNLVPLRRHRLAETIALVGGDTLLGREVRDVFAESSLASQLRLVAAEEEETGKLTEIDGAATFLTKLEPDALENA